MRILCTIIHVPSLVQYPRYYLISFLHNPGISMVHVEGQEA